MEKEITGLVTFKSTHHTIQAEGVFESREINFKVIPTPREITKSCGLAIVFSMDDLNGVREIIEDDSIKIENVYRYTKDGKARKAEKII